MRMISPENREKINKGIQRRKKQGKIMKTKYTTEHATHNFNLRACTALAIYTIALEKGFATMKPYAEFMKTTVREMKAEYKNLEAFQIVLALPAGLKETIKKIQDNE